MQAPSDVPRGTSSFHTIANAVAGSVVRRRACDAPHADVLVLSGARRGSPPRALRQMSERSEVPAQYPMRGGPRVPQNTDMLGEGDRMTTVQGDSQRGHGMRWKLVAALLGVLLAINCVTDPRVARAATTRRLAVLELRTSGAVTAEEAAYLTDRVRGVASRALPSSSFLVLTRESIQDLLPPGVKLADCLSGECEVEVGRKIGADYIVAGEILKFGDGLRMNLKAYHCVSGAFLGNETAAGAKLDQLEQDAIGVSSRLFAAVRAHSGAGMEVEGSVGDATRHDWSPPADSSTVVGFNSEPPGAVVLVDGRVLCQGTPCTREIAVGATTVTMQKERYLPKAEVVDITRKTPPLLVSWTLEPDFGWLTVTSTPPGLPVTINGRPAGQSPLEGSELPQGSYEIHIVDPRYYDRGERIALVRGTRRTIAITPGPREGAVRVSAREPDSSAVAAQVLIDGVDAGTTPCTIKVLVGRHAVAARADGAEWADSVTVVEHQVAVLNVQMPKSPWQGQSASGATVTIGTLMWTVQDNGRDVTWAEAKAYAVACRVDGYSEWRLPTLRELESIRDDKRGLQSEYGALFVKAPLLPSVVWYWSSTEVGGRAYASNFRNGYSMDVDKTDTMGERVFLVRAPQIDARRHKQ